MHPYFNLVIKFFFFFSINVFNCFSCCCTFHNRVCGTLRYEIILLSLLMNCWPAQLSPPRLRYAPSCSAIPFWHLWFRAQLFLINGSIDRSTMDTCNMPASCCSPCHMPHIPWATQCAAQFCGLVCHSRLIIAIVLWASRFRVLRKRFKRSSRHPLKCRE